MHINVHAKKGNMEYKITFLEQGKTSVMILNIIK